MPLNQSDFLGGVLAPASAAYEPARTNNAVLVLTTASLEAALGMQDAGKELRLALAGFSLPKNETQPIMVPYLNEMRKFAGTTTFDDVTVSFHDYVDAKIAKILWKWRYLIHDPTTGLRGLKVRYACGGAIEQFAPDGGLTRTYKLEGVWPMSINMGDVEMGADEPIRIQVNFCCDKVYPHPDSGGQLDTFGTPSIPLGGGGSSGVETF